MAKFFLAVLALAAAARGDSDCTSFTDCGTCLNPSDESLNCGWCSPDPAVYADGTPAFQCMDHTSKGWDCFHLYMHDGCVAGYICDSSKGQCVLADEGQGDTLANCEASCDVDPEQDYFTCNVTTLQCVNASAGMTEESCSGSCSDDTPSDLIGLWRGLNVQTNFSTGEFVMNFTEDGVSWGPYGGEKVHAHVAQIGGPKLRLTLDSGDVLYASYTTPNWPTGPETGSMTISLEREGAHQAPPDNTADAMGDSNFDVFVMNRCNSWKSDAGCDFSAAFSPLKLLHGRRLGSSDQCTGNEDCDSCINDASSVCGWCDGVVLDTDGNVICGDDGLGCCGGSDGFSTCNVTFRKECPVVCDWTNWTDPFCRAASSAELKDDTVQKFTDCDQVEEWHACTAETYNYCDNATMQCATVYDKDECIATPGCDPDGTCDSSVCKVPTFTWCDSVLGCQSTTNSSECDANPDCDTNSTESCDPTVCIATEYYACDTDSYQCKKKTGPYDPSWFNTSDACDAVCFPSDVTGIWRALRIDSGFVADEWDFNFGDSAAGASVTFKSKLSGDEFTGTYLVGDLIETESYGAATMTITLASGEVLSGLVNNDLGKGTAEGPITKFMYLGLPLQDSDTAASFDDAMADTKQEFVLVACLDNIHGCDFSSVF